jgi:hypothetical protein
MTGTTVDFCTYKSSRKRKSGRRRRRCGGEEKIAERRRNTRHGKIMKDHRVNPASTHLAIEETGQLTIGKEIDTEIVAVGMRMIR